MAREKNIFGEEEGGERSVRNLWRTIDRGAEESRTVREGRILWAVAALVVAVAVFSAVLWFSYPGKNAGDSLSAPVIRADADPYRAAPDSAGGMEIADSQSTVFNAMRGGEAEEKSSAPPVENLLAAGEDAEPVSRDHLFAGLNTKPPGESSSSSDSGGSGAAPSGEQAVAQQAGGAVDPANAKAPAAHRTEDLLTMGSPLAPKAAMPSAGTIPQEDNKDKPLILSAQNPVPAGASAAGGGAVAASGSVSGESSAVPSASAADVEKKIASATLKKAEALAKTEPAAGVAAPVAKTVEKVASAKKNAQKSEKSTSSKTSSVGKVAPGPYYVQLASLPVRGNATKEWAVLQAKYSELKPLSMRVQEASLPAGTFYRIQAGPMAKADADRICSAIKVRKPGGCLVIKR